ncbi:lecithin-cholesterol acyltransferase-like 4 isoform X1 [Zingiber officinale]|uniref:lecithin-cholesterol acyltransferase-like 4 isoform X1 n=1 Tax=Zingiber officinale TaxID=94328 RepID=UPI001C4AA203|nr:lecithin-cholesterol acyltransferase-like 4 isoform X1 [Zingiber officinale]
MRMAVLDELIRSIELWLRLAKEQVPLVDPNLDPVMLVPGIAGSILNAVDDDGKEERVWVRILRAEHEFREKVWSHFDPATGKTVSLDDKTRIIVPEDRYGLYAIDCLDPDMIVGRDGVCYYHDMIQEMIKWGYQEGKTLFGFGYDFRQSNRLQDTLDKFSAKLESVYVSSGGKKMNIITHSMGGLLVKCFMSLYSDIFEKYVKGWIAIAAPFQGAPGYITTSLLNGMSFVEGWEGNFFITKWSMQQLLIECPSIYELMARPNFSWDVVPLLQLWKEKHDDSGTPGTLLESYEPLEAISLINEALAKNTQVSYGDMQVPLPLNIEILRWANETSEILSRAKLPNSVKFYNIYGTHNDTPHSVCYGSKESPISDVEQLVSAEAKYICVDGDGTVPTESAKADGFDAVARVAVPADHRGIICDRHVFRILQHWLNAGEPDPFYNPLNDYVVLPTAFEIERHTEKSMQVTTVKEDWEIISSVDLNEKRPGDLPAMVGSVSVSSGGDNERAQATVVVHPQSQGRQHVEVMAVSVTM